MAAPVKLRVFAYDALPSSAPVESSVGVPPRYGAHFVVDACCGNRSVKQTRASCLVYLLHALSWMRNRLTLLILCHHCETTVSSGPVVGHALRARCCVLCFAARHLTTLKILLVSNPQVFWTNCGLAHLVLTPMRRLCLFGNI